MLLLNYVYGSTIALEYLYKKRYLEHNERVQSEVSPGRLLVMDLTGGDGWDKLCAFLGMPAPDMPFPHRHRGVQRIERTA